LRSSGAGIKFEIDHETGAGFKISPGACLQERQRRQGFRGGFSWNKALSLKI